MDHRQANTSRQKLKTKLHSVPQEKAYDYERSFLMDALNCEVNIYY